MNKDLVIDLDICGQAGLGFNSVRVQRCQFVNGKVKGLEYRP